MSQSGALPSTRGYGITKADLEASRLVFVSLKNSVPKRKVAVPVPDGYSWEQFLQQIKTKLRLEGVGSVHFASTGERITSLDGLEDIDELCVEEAATVEPESNGSRAAPVRSESKASDFHISHPPSTRLHRPASGGAAHHNASTGNEETIAEDEEEKYAKRSNLLRRMTQRIFPDLFAPGLPVTTPRSASNEEKVAKKRRRRRGTDHVVLLLLCAVIGSCLTMILVYFKTRPTADTP